jgi:4-hydroxybenzoate polyprenyltransferase
LSSVSPGRSRSQAWMSLVRIPAVFTVIAQVVSAFMLAGGTVFPVPRLVLVTLASVALYWSGMIFNDVFDFDEDLRERPKRPLPSGEVPLPTAKVAAASLMAIGVVLATLAGFIPDASAPQTFCPGIIAIALSICILLYDGPLKHTPLASLAMGTCRGLCFLLGAAPWIALSPEGMGDVTNWFPGHVLAAAIGMGIYVMGVTLISRGETNGENVAEIVGGVVVIVLGSIVLAISPQFAPALTQWAASIDQRFALLIGLIVFAVVVRGIRISLRPEVAAIQNVIRVALMTLIPLSAAFALLSVGPIAGLAVFSLFVPAIISAARFRVT